MNASIAIYLLDAYGMACYYISCNIKMSELHVSRIPNFFLFLSSLFNFGVIVLVLATTKKTLGFTQ